VPEDDDAEVRPSAIDAGEVPDANEAEIR